MLHKLSFYKTAADLLKLVKDSGKNVKNILFSERKYKFMVSFRLCLLILVMWLSSSMAKWKLFRRSRLQISYYDGTLELINILAFGVVIEAFLM